MNWMLRRGQDDINPHLLRDLKSNSAATVHTTTATAVQQQSNGTSASTYGLCDNHGASVFVLSFYLQFSLGDTCDHDGHIST